MSAVQKGTGPFGRTFSVSRLAADVYTLTWDTQPGAPVIGNSTFIIGESDVVVVDTGLSRAAGQVVLGALRQITSKPVATVVNTHWHGDHHFGNQAFAAQFPHARFVAHPETRASIISRDVSYRADNRPRMMSRIAELRALAARTDADSRELARSELQMAVWEGDYVLPDVLVDSRLTLMQGQRRIDVLHLGAANTTGDLLVHLPAEKLLISGDVAITPAPFAYFSSPRAWIATLDRILAIDFSTIVPGHGNPQSDRRFIRDLQSMLKEVVAQVDAGKQQGAGVETLKQTVKVTAPAGSIYASLSAADLDRHFRIPAIEAAFAEPR